MEKLLVTELQREVLEQIKQGIDSARHEGVLVEYPRGAFINGEWVDWPFDRLSDSATPLQTHTKRTG